MLRKWMTMLLALMLAFMLPVTALADRQYTLTVIPGDLLASEQIIADLCQTTAIRLTKGERSGALTLVMNGEPMATIGLSADDTGLYAASADLLEDVLYVSWDDLFALMADGMMAMYEEAGMDDAALQAVTASVDSAKTGISSLFTETVSDKPYSAETMEESLQSVEEIFPDDPAMVAFVNGLEDNIVIEEGQFTSDVHDTADGKIVFTMDGKDLADLFDTDYMRSMMMEVAAAGGEEMTEAEVREFAAEMCEMLKKLYAESDFAMIMEMFTANEGEALVGVDMDMHMNIDTQLEGEQMKASMTMNADYNRLSGSNGISHEAAASLTVDGEAIAAEFTMLDGADGADKCMLGFLVDGEELVITYRATAPENAVRERRVAVYLRSGATAILEPAASDRPIIGFKLVSEPAPEEVLAALENASEANSVNVLKLSEEEMQQMLTKVLSSGEQIYYNILGALPTSVLNLLAESGI